MTSSPPSATPRLGSQLPRVSHYPPYVSSEAEDAIELAASAGLVLDEWQQYVLRHALGRRPDGKWSAFRVSCWVPRQNGKGAVIETRELAGLFLFGEQLQLHSAHEYKTAQEAFLRIKTLIQMTPDLDRLVNRYWQANGEQGIELISGQRLRFVARSRTSGRGFSGDNNILDESQELTVEQMAALMPTMSARPDPQLWFFGTPPDDAEAWVYAVREAGEARAPRLAHFDWGGDLNLTKPEDLAKVAEVDRWYAGNPALGIRITEEFVADELSTLGAEKFAAERLGVWRPRGEGLEPPVLDPALWKTMVDEQSRRGGECALMLDISPLRNHASIGLYSQRDDGLEHMQLLDYRPGTDWCVTRLAELKEALGPLSIGIDEKGGAYALLDDLAVAGIRPPEDPDAPRRGDLLIMQTSDVASSVGQFIDGYRQQRYRHPDQQPLADAVANAKTRPIGDAGAIAWGRKLSAVDIGPLIVITGARYAYWARIDQVTAERDPIGIW